jgi:DNA-binding PadR family transcriptional regulator
MKQGSLYPALQRLEKEGLITSDWGVTHNNRRARMRRPGTAPIPQRARR